MNRLKTTFLLSLLTVLMVFMGSALGGTAGMVLAFLMTCAMNLFSYWFSDKIVLKIINNRFPPAIPKTAAISLGRFPLSQVDCGGFRSFFLED